jgi:hypothetical protein
MPGNSPTAAVQSDAPFYHGWRQNAALVDNVNILFNFFLELFLQPFQPGGGGLGGRDSSTASGASLYCADFEPQSFLRPKKWRAAPFQSGTMERDLIYGPLHPMVLRMGVPNVPLNVTAEQVGELNKKLSHMRHEVNNQLALAVAALELVRYRPELRDKMFDTVGQQTPKITAEIAKFTAEFEQFFGITRD